MIDFGLTQGDKEKIILYLDYKNKKDKQKRYIGDHAMQTAIRMELPIDTIQKMYELFLYTRKINKK